MTRFKESNILQGQFIAVNLSEKLIVKINHADARHFLTMFVVKNFPLSYASSSNNMWNFKYHKIKVRK